jgi:hypothetical protein
MHVAAVESAFEIARKSNMEPPLGQESREK